MVFFYYQICYTLNFETLIFNNIKYCQLKLTLKINMVSCGNDEN